MLSEYPIKIENVAIPFPSEWTENSNVVENTGRSEAGTDISIVTRYDKLSIRCRFTVLSEWAQKFKQWSFMDVLALTRYEPSTGEYDVRTVRIRNFSASLKRNSHKLKVTNGVWEVSFVLEEV